MKEKIKAYIQAGYAGLFLLSHEEQRVEAEMKAVADELGCRLHAWSTTEGLTDVTGQTITDCPDPLEVLERVEGMPDKSIVLLRDFHLFLDDPNPILMRKLKEVLVICRRKGTAIAVVGCRCDLPIELKREITLVEFSLPDQEALAKVLEGICSSAAIAVPRGENRDRILDAAGGLTTSEAENAFALSVVEKGSVSPDIVTREKALALKKGGLLEVVPNRETLEDIGGLDVLKSWLLKRRSAFGSQAREYGLPSPKGLLITGVPGTGKSLTAKATAAVFGLPLLRLDVGKLFAGVVGQSESNLRSAIQTAEAMAPCVLMVDELEKGLSGSKSSGSTDGGTSSRVFGGFLSWMQEKSASVFVVATANDVTQLPPEMLRKGRFDNLFFVDLPNEEEREAIWAIQIRRYGRKPESFDLKRLAAASGSMTGSEIEQAFVEGLYQAFSMQKEPTTSTLEGVVAESVPLAKTMSDQIEGLRQWAKTRAQFATTQPKGDNRKSRKIAVGIGRN